MKLVFILASMLIIGCTETKFGVNRVHDKPYPGESIDDSDHCYHMWDIGWTFDVLKCEAHFKNPKFKTGQKIRFSKDKNYDSSCYGIISGLYGWSVVKGPKQNQAIYLHSVVCQDKSMGSEESLESELIK